MHLARKMVCNLKVTVAKLMIGIQYYLPWVPGVESVPNPGLSLTRMPSGGSAKLTPIDSPYVGSEIEPDSRDLRLATRAMWLRLLGMFTIVGGGSQNSCHHPAPSNNFGLTLLFCFQNQLFRVPQLSVFRRGGTGLKGYLLYTF